MNRNDFKRLTSLRLAESRRLFASGHSEGAFYLAGYAVECALKACYARKTRRFDFPPERKEYDKIYSHDLEGLATIAGVRGDLDQKGTRTSYNWNLVVERWSHASRYRFPTKQDAMELISAINETRSVSVYTETLVDKDITDGRKLIDALRKAGIQVEAALWYFATEMSEWRLMIQLPLSDSISP